MMLRTRRAAPIMTVLLLLLTLFLAYGDIPAINTTYDQWIDWARIAWGYFQPGVGVNSNTGLHYATSGWHRFTDWDLGVYVEAIIDAERLGIVSRDGDWGANYRLNKILGFLETRQITSDGLPYAQYDADRGSVPADVGSRTAHPSDSAKLLLALDDLKHFRPDLEARINALVARHSFQSFAGSSYFSWNDIYPFYVAQGYQAFGYSTPKLRPLDSLGDGSSVEVYGEILPKARITSEPLVSAILENRDNALYRAYADRIFSAQQKRYEATGKLTAFSEGPYFGPHYYVYEWVVNAQGESWVVYASGKINAVPVAYSKIAFAFHAIYSNQYTSVLVDQLSPLHAASPSGGFYEGRTEEAGGARLDVLSDKTNGMILAAARYFVSHTTVTTTTSSTTSSSSLTTSTSSTTSSPTSTDTSSTTTLMTSSSSTTGPVTTTASTTTSPATTETTSTSVSTGMTSTIETSTGHLTTETSGTSVSTETTTTDTSSTSITMTSSSSTTGPVTTTASTTTGPETTETTSTSVSTETTTTTAGNPTTSGASTNTALETTTSQLETTNAGQMTESSSALTGPCVIATAAYGSEMAPEVVYMRHVRDNLIGSTPIGKVLRDGFNNFYYSWSPALARAVAGSELLRALFRTLLAPLVGIVHLTAICYQLLGGGDFASIVAFAIAALLVMAVYTAVPALFLTLTIERIRKRRV